MRDFFHSFVCVCVEMECVEGQMQSEEISLTKIEARHLKFVILTAHDHFVSVHKLQIDGDAVRGWQWHPL